MNICFFAGAMNNGGGTEHMTQLVANALAEQKKYKVYILSKSDKGEKPFYPISDYVEYQVLDNAPYKGVGTLLKDIFLLKKYIRLNKIDILINVDVLLGIFTLPLKILCPNLKQIFWEHFSVHYNNNNKRMNWIRNLALKIGNAYVTLTKEDAIELDKRVRKHCVLTNIPNICTYEPSNKLYSMESKTILSVGNMLRVKGFDYALDVAKIVFQKHPDWKWEFYGDGSELEMLKKKSVKLGIDDKVLFMGRVKNLEKAYEKAALYVMTSRSEGFGLVLTEAQAHHLPTLAFDIPYGPRNIIYDNKNGFLVEPYNVDTMAKKICELIEIPSKRKCFSDNACCGLNRFSSRHVIENWEKLLEEI